LISIFDNDVEDAYSFYDELDPSEQSIIDQATDINSLSIYIQELREDIDSSVNLLEMDN
jgi:hypothetical protein